LDLNKLKSNTLACSIKNGVQIKIHNPLVSENLVLIPAGIWLLEMNEWLNQMLCTREVHRNMFFSRFNPSMVSLEKYLRNGPIEDSNQILFLIIDARTTYHGQVGFKIINQNICELHNVLRISHHTPGLMRTAISELMKWVNSELRIKNFTLKVISTNLRAITLYQMLGFQCIDSVPLRVNVISDSETRLEPCIPELASTEEKMLILQKNI
jgi:RimJ/RimL family protein N-acetyltransferase